MRRPTSAYHTLLLDRQLRAPVPVVLSLARRWHSQGAKPAELPFEQPTRVKLVINLKTAKELRFEVPPALLATDRPVFHWNRWAYLRVVVYRSGSIRAVKIPKTINLAAGLFFST
jgi:hypothetical protein